jgi:glyoxylase-like metal-dependent hydrolase (beta-lactamase superfamily II)
MLLAGAAVIAAPMAASQPAGPNFGWVPPDDRGVTGLGVGLSVVTLSFPGNVAVLSGADGILLVDNQMPQLDELLVSEIEAISGNGAGAVRFIINTHGHPDHAGSNAIWKERGATIVAHDNVRVAMSTEVFNPMDNTVTPPLPEGLWPVVTFNEDMTLHLNGQTVHIVHPDPAHTNGDSIVYFIEANAVHTGDIYLNKAFPVVDAANGGSLDGIIAALEGIAARIDDETRVIPGHGPVSNKAELEAYTASIREMRTIITELVELGMTREQVVAAQPLARFEEEFDLLTGLFPADVIVAGAYQAVSEGR